MPAAPRGQGVVRGRTPMLHAVAGCGRPIAVNPLTAIDLWLTRQPRFRVMEVTMSLVLLGVLIALALVVLGHNVPQFQKFPQIRYVLAILVLAATVAVSPRPRWCPRAMSGSWCS